MLNLKWKQRKDYPGKSKGKNDYPGAKGDMGVPPGSSVPKSNLGKGADYPGKKGNKGVDLPKSGKGSTAKEAAKGD